MKHSIEITEDVVKNIFNDIEEYQGVVEITNMDILIKGMISLANNPLGGTNVTPFKVFLENLVRQAVELGSKGVVSKLNQPNTTANESDTWNTMSASGIIIGR